MAGLVVYADFFNYGSGVYEHLKGDMVGGHAVKIIGWGTEIVNDEEIEYWLCQNQWGEDWGDKGFFKIKFGEGWIENYVFSCQPDLSHWMELEMVEFSDTAFDRVIGKLLPLNRKSIIT